MKEAIVDADTNVNIQDVSVPSPGPNQLLIKVVAFGTNPKDWKLPKWADRPHNSGDDVAGYVESIGSNVDQFVRGMRVAGLHDWSKAMKETVPGGAYGEYALVQANTAFAIPENVSFEEAATVPLAGLTAAMALFYDLGLPSPFTKTEQRPESTPLVIYGISAAIGAFALKLATAANIHPIIAVGSSTSEFLKPYINASKGDVLVDYKQYKKPSELTAAITAAIEKAGAGPALHAFDAISQPGTYYPVLSDVLKLGASADNGSNPTPTMVLSMPGLDLSVVNKSVHAIWTSVGKVHVGDNAQRSFGTVWTRLLAEGLKDGWLTPHPHEVLKGGLEGLEEGLKRLRNDEVRGKKLVGRIADTPRLGK